MKEYRKPCSVSFEDERGLVPIAAAATATQLAPAAALVGGYAVGRAIKQMMEVTQVSRKQGYLDKVLVY